MASMKRSENVTNNTYLRLLFSYATTSCNAGPYFTKEEVNDLLLWPGFDHPIPRRQTTTIQIFKYDRYIIIDRTTFSTSIEKSCQAKLMKN